jgi:hypothetical protein
MLIYAGQLRLLFRTSKFDKLFRMVVTRHVSCQKSSPHSDLSHFNDGFSRSCNSQQLGIRGRVGRSPPCSKHVKQKISGTI